MNGPPQDKPFQRRAFFDEPELAGARWWQESLVTHVQPLTRRAAMGKMTAVLIGVGALGLVVALTRRRRSPSVEPPAQVIDRDTLELQREQGWDVGHTGERPSFPGATALDVAEQGDWAGSLGGLAETLAPKQGALAPYYVPTSFQSLIPSSSAALRQALTPIHDADMDAAYARGQALAALFGEDDAPEGTAVLVDAPGPVSVALAAGMADRFEPVFLFDNWPHPVGVVPSHLAIAAALYYLPRFRAARETRPTPAPALFVADDRRLSPYSDRPDQFDNRYLLRLPSVDGMHALGIKRLLYLRPSSGQIELDDLNDDFVALAAAGIEIKVAALDDFRETTWTPPASAPVVSTTTTTPPPARRSYYWGGHPTTHILFWPTYGWSRAPSRPSPSRPSPSPSLSPSPSPSPSPHPMPPAPSGAAYRPTPRPTMFSSHVVGGTPGVGRIKPTGFGRVSVRTSSPGGSLGRSTSYSGG